MQLRTIIPVMAALTITAPAVEAQLTRPLGDMMDEFRWRSIGPPNMGGRVTDVEGVPSPSKTFYVAGAASGIWKTTNNGTTFEQIWTDERVVSMGDLAVSPSNPNIVWAGTGEEDSRNSISPGGGIFKSVDGGRTWRAMGLRETQVIARIVVHPIDPDIVHVAALGHIWDSNPERGLYRTLDGGETWELVKFISDRAGFVDVVRHPRDPDVLFASSWERERGPYYLQSGGPGSGLWKTMDGGDSWTEIVGNGFPTGEKGRIGLAIAPSSPRTMYALVEARAAGEEDGFGANGLYRSTDGGDSWQRMNSVNSRPFYYSQVRVDPRDPNRVYFSSTPVQFSDDGGRTYGTTTNAIHVDHHAMWIDPNDPDRIVVGNDGGVAISYDRGGNWSYLNHLPMGQFYDISVNMDVPYRVCGGLQDNGTWCGPSRLPDGQITAYHWASISGGDGFVSAQDPEDPDLVWSESQGANMGRLNLATGERTRLTKPDWDAAWTPKQDTILMLLDEGADENDARIHRLRTEATRDSAAAVMRYNWNTPLLQSSHVRSWFYTAGNRVLKSDAWGDELRIISPDLSYADPEKIRVATETTGGITTDVTGAETYATVSALDESPLARGKLFAGTDDGRVWMTEDDGGTWTELTGRISGVPEGHYVSRVKASNHDANRVYVTFDGHRTNDLDPYVIVSDDNGVSFRSIAAGLPTGSVDFVHVVEEDPKNENLLFVGTDVGAYVSTDRGRRWQRFMNGLPTVPVHDLEVHPRDKELVAATHGRSIWVVDIAPLQELTDAVVADGALLAPKTAFQFGYPARGGESYGQEHWGRPTPGAVAELSYFLTAEQVEAVRASSGEAGASDGSGGEAGRPSGPRVEITITDPDGEPFQTIRGPANEGLNRVTWDMRGEAESDGPGPYQARRRVQIAERAASVRDSLIAEGWNEQFFDRIVGMFTGPADVAQLAAMFGGGGAPTGDPEDFRERPGESPPAAGGGFDYGQVIELAGILLPGAGMSQFSRMFTRGGPQIPLAEPGSYGLSLAAGDETLSAELRVERIGELTGDRSTFEDEWVRLLRSLERVR